MRKYVVTALGAALLGISPANAQNAAHDLNGGLSGHNAVVGKVQVSGTGYALQSPDQASVSAGVISEGKSAGDAMRANAALMNSVFEALKAAGIERKDITTSQMSLRPRYNHDQPRSSGDTPTIVGYEVRNTVMAKSNDMDNVGPMLDALVSAGVNNINGVNFSIKDAKSARAKARTDAVKEARVKAETLAAAAGLSLGSVIQISESRGYEMPQPMMLGMRVDSYAMQSTPIAAGEQTLSVTVNMTYALDQ